MEKFGLDRTYLILHEPSSTEAYSYPDESYETLNESNALRPVC